MNAVRQATERLYHGICNVTEYKKKRDEVTKQTQFEEVEVLKAQPCRLSFARIASTDNAHGIPKKNMSTKLIISPDIVIAPGSKIVVTQNGVTTAYKRSGEPAIYSSHQEIMIELFDGWA